MTSWEQRMSDRAKAKQAAEEEVDLSALREQAEYRRNHLTDAEQAYVDQMAEGLTPESVRYAHACACTGGISTDVGAPCHCMLVDLAYAKAGSDKVSYEPRREWPFPAPRST